MPKKVLSLGATAPSDAIVNSTHVFFYQNKNGAIGASQICDAVIVKF
jgi:hypothetical protein